MELHTNVHVHIFWHLWNQQLLKGQSKHQRKGTDLKLVVDDPLVAYITIGKTFKVIRHHTKKAMAWNSEYVRCPKNKTIPQLRSYDPQENSVTKSMQIFFRRIITTWATCVRMLPYPSNITRKPRSLFEVTLEDGHCSQLPETPCKTLIISLCKCINPYFNFIN